MDMNHLLNQFFSSQSNHPSTGEPENHPADTHTSWTDTAKNIAQQATQGGFGGFAGGAITGGLLSLLLTNEKARKVAGGALGYGGAAALGAMAMKAYQNYQATKCNKSTTPNTQATPVNQTNTPAARDTTTTSSPFAVMLIKSMVIAAKVDGHIDATEQERIFNALEKSALSTEEKGIILDTLSKPIDLSEITTHSFSTEQAAQIYLASRIAIDPDQPAEKASLSNLATGLKLPPELISQLEFQLTQRQGETVK